MNMTDVDMTVTYSITLGWWLAPFVVSILAALFVVASISEYRPTGGWFDVDVKSIGVFVAGLIASLIAWLIWALLT